MSNRGRNSTTVHSTVTGNSFETTTSTVTSPTWTAASTTVNGSPLTTPSPSSSTFSPSPSTPTSSSSSSVSVTALRHLSPRKMDAAVLVSSVVALVLYWNTLDADFAYDDSRAIKTNQDLLPSAPLTGIFYNDFWGTPLTHSGSHKSYRPLCVLSFRINYYLGEFRPYGYHLGNVLLHSLVTGLFVHLARQLLRGHSLSTWVAGLTFAAHPVHTEAVAGVVGRADVGSCLFFLIALISYIKYCKWRDWWTPCPVSQSVIVNNGGNQRRRTNVTSPMITMTSFDGGGGGGGNFRFVYLAVALMSATASLLTKEHGITVLAVCAIYDILVHCRLRPKELPVQLFQKKYRGLVEGLCALTSTVALLMTLRIQLMGNKPPDFAPADNPAADSDSAVTRTLTFLYLPTYNFWLLLCPRWLSFDWSMEALPLITSPLDFRNIYTLAFYAGLLKLTIYIIDQINNYNEITLNNHVTSSKKKSMMTSSSLNNCPTMTSSSLSMTSLSSNTMAATCLVTSCGTNGTGSGSSASSTSSTSSSTSSNGSTSSASTSAASDLGYWSNPPQPMSSQLNSYYYMTSSNLYNLNWTCTSNCSTRGASKMTSPSRKVTRATRKMTSNTFNTSGGHLDVLIVSLTVLVLPFVPATNLFFYVGFVVAERVLYIPSMGFCLLIGLGVQLVYNRRRCKTRTGNRILLIVVCTLLVVVFSIRTVRRNRDWLTEENLYRSGIPVNPPKAFGNLANILSAQGKKDEAEWAYKKALSYRSNMADVHYNLGILLQEQKRFEEAQQSYRLAIQFRPRMAMAHLNLGLILGILGRKSEATEVYRHCSQLDGTGLKDPRTHENTKISALFNLGRLYADDGKYLEAIEVYKEAVRKMPNHYQPQSLYNMLGEAYFKLERYEEAEHWYKEALRAKPDHIPAHLTYGKMLAKLQNRVSEAEQWFARAKLLAPNDSSVYQHYGQFLSETERHAEAANQYVRAAELAPDEYEIIFNAANTLRQAGKNEEAEKYYRLAVKLRPTEATSHMNLGAMLHVNGKLLEAEMSYLEALKLKPEDGITQNNLQKLRNLLSKRGIRTTHETKR